MPEIVVGFEVSALCTLWSEHRKWRWHSRDAVLLLYELGNASSCRRNYDDEWKSSGTHEREL